jgi:hypothetical protein
MRRHWFVAVFAAALALGGCSSDQPDEPAPPAGTAAPAPAPAAASSPGPSAAADGPAAFVATVQAEVPEVALDRRDEEIEAIARQACADLAAGKDAEAVVAATRTLGTSDAEAADQATARELVKLAIDTVCPDQSGRVDEF